MLSGLKSDLSGAADCLDKLAVRFLLPVEISCPSGSDGRALVGAGPGRGGVLTVVLKENAELVVFERDGVDSASVVTPDEASERTVSATMLSADWVEVRLSLECSWGEFWLRLAKPLPSELLCDIVM